jgi:S1-C subfamily serine protease
VQGAVSVSVDVINNGRTYNATVVGVDPTDDVAVLQLANASDLPSMPLGDSSRVSVGDSVSAIGNALGRGGAPTVSHGTVTALGQTVTATDPGGANAETLTNMIAFNAQIQPGDSGGPLVDSSGKVIGMDTAGGGRVRRANPGSSTGFAIPINTAITIAHQITSGSNAPNITSAHAPLLGVEAQDSTAPLGALVVGVQPGTPAEGAGIVARDVIVSLDGTTIDAVSTLHTALLRHKPGDSVDVAWLDPSGAQHHATVQLAAGAVP